MYNVGDGSGGRKERMKLWGGRFGKATDGLVDDFHSSISFDQRLYEQDITGSIEKGKRADLAILRLDVPSMVPTNDLIAALSYSANGSEVDTVIIDGKIVMEHRELKTIDEERVYHEIAETCKRVGL